MKKDNEENLKIFEGMGNNQIFSQYSGELNRVFKDKSFDKFYNNLLSNRQYKSDENSKYFNGEDEHKRFNTFVEKRDFNRTKYQKFIEKLNLEEKREKEKLKQYRNQFKITKKPNELTLFEKQLKRRKIIEDRINFNYPDMGKYNPNYKSIRKNLPKIEISRDDFDPNKKYPIIGRDLFPIKKDTINYLSNENEENDDYKIKVSKTYDFSREKKFSGRNSVLKFDFYTSRKPLAEEKITKNIIDNSEIPNSCDPKKLKGLVNFNKMSTDIENTKFIPNPDKIKNSNPPIGMYKPKFNHLSRNSRDIYINRLPVINKLTQVKKLMYSYNVPSQYQLVGDLNENRYKNVNEK